MGNFCDTIKPGAVRIGTSCYSDELEVTAFLNPYDHIVCVLLNRTGHDLKVNLRLGNSMTQMMVEACAIVSVVIY